MRTLYIFPHPDDESFGPAPVIHQQIKNGEEVFLLTLTKGGATKQRHKFGYSIEEMGKVRSIELANVCKVLSLTGSEIWDLEDGGLEKLDILHLENMVQQHIESIKPEIIVTYPVHGISGHHDHLVIHAAVKRIFASMKLKAENSWLRRLAFLSPPPVDHSKENRGNPNAKSSKPELIDCIVNLESDDIACMKQALDCYETYGDIIQAYDVVNHIGTEVHFEFYAETFQPPVHALSAGIFKM